MKLVQPSFNNHNKRMDLRTRGELAVFYPSIGRTVYPSKAVLWSFRWLWLRIDWIIPA